MCFPGKTSAARHFRLNARGSLRAHLAARTRRVPRLATRHARHGVRAASSGPAARVSMCAERAPLDRAEATTPVVFARENPRIASAPGAIHRRALRADRKKGPYPHHSSSRFRAPAGTSLSLFVATTRPAAAHSPRRRRRRASAQDPPSVKMGKKAKGKHRLGASSLRRRVPCPRFPPARRASVSRPQPPPPRR